MTASTVDTLQQPAPVGQMLLNAIERHREAVAVVDGDRTFTYRQMGQDVAHTIAAFRELGAGPGDRIVQISRNRYEMIVVLAASYIGGFVSVPLLHGGEIEEQAFAVGDSRPALLVLEEGLQSRQVALARASGGPYAVLSHEALARRFAAGEAPPLGTLAADTDGHACARMVYTGGTTGRPKGVMNSASALAFSALLLAFAHDLTADTAFLLCAPISHGAGSFIVPVLAKGGRLIVHRRFDVDAVTRAFRQGEANSALLVPTMLYALLDHPGSRDIPRGAIRRIIYGAAPASPTRLREALDRFGYVLAQSYGQTEVPSAICYLSPEDHRDERRLSSAGKPYPGVDVRLMSDGRLLPRRSREVGEVCGRAPHVMTGYWDKPELTAEAMQGGWLHTGDLAFEDEDGYLHIVDRLKDMIISGGFNVYPSEVEAALQTHPCVEFSALIGVPHGRGGEAAHAFVVLRKGSTTTEAELQNHVRERLGPLKTPKSIAFIPSLPLTKVGKVDKKRLREPFWAGTARNVN